MARPIPLVAPVTMAALSCSRFNPEDLLQPPDAGDRAAHYCRPALGVNENGGNGAGPGRTTGSTAGYPSWLECRRRAGTSGGFPRGTP
jgi:hypothetical protein